MTTFHILFCSRELSNRCTCRLRSAFVRESAVSLSHGVGLYSPVYVLHKTHIRMRYQVPDEK